MDGKALMTMKPITNSALSAISYRLGVFSESAKSLTSAFKVDK